MRPKAQSIRPSHQAQSSGPVIRPSRGTSRWSRRGSSLRPVHRADVIDGLQAEGGRLAAVMLDLGDDEFDTPTPCVPWTVGELLAHVLVASNRLPDMLAAPEPDHAVIGPADYYRPDERFAPDANQTRVATAQADAVAAGTGHALAEAFDAAWREMVRLAVAEPPTRVVRTRWGDAMVLTDFLVTRVIEIAVHGLDLAVALGRDPWMTPQAAALTEEVLLGGPSPGGASLVSQITASQSAASQSAASQSAAGTTTDAIVTLGWDRLGLIQKATGRSPLTAAEAQLLAEHGVHWLTLG